MVHNKTFNVEAIEQEDADDVDVEDLNGKELGEDDADDR